MLSQPFQNSEYLHRTETVSELRNSELQRTQAATEQAANANRRHEEQKENEVEDTKHVELDPDGSTKQEQRKGGRRNRTKQEPGSSPKPKLPRSLGGGHIDITV